MTQKKMTALTGSAQTHPSSGYKAASVASEEDIAVIRFEGVKVRVINICGEPWFVAKDVCTALDLSNSRMVLMALDEDEKNTVS